MKKIITGIKKIILGFLDWFSKINWFRFSLVSLVVVAINFFPLITKLGFYLDDWPQLYSWTVHGLNGIKEYWAADSRSFAWWVEGFLFPIFGTRAVLWHIFLALLRWFTSILFWLIFNRIWPKQKFAITAAALLFGIYPLFAQQSSGMMFTTIWMSFTLYLLSVWLMIIAVQSKKWFALLMVISVALDLVNLLTCEYFLGLEFLRPFLILLALEHQGLLRAKKILRAFLYSIPWLAIALGYLIWRAFLITTPTLRSATIFTQLVSAPFQTILQLFQSVIKDFIQINFTVWFNIFNPVNFDLSVPADVLALVLGIVILVMSGVYLIHLYNRTKDEEHTQKSKVIQFLWFGGLAVIFGAAPGWAIGKGVSDASGIWNDRYGIASMMGACIFLVGFLILMVKPTRGRIAVLLAVMIALSTGSNFRIANEYRWSTIYQTRFYNQLAWRAPSIKPNTTILSANELFPKMGVYPTAFALNTIYPNSNSTTQVNYWFFTIEKYFADNIAELNEWMNITTKKWYVNYEAASTDSLVIRWAYPESTCLWILDENDRNNPYVTTAAQQVLATSNLSRINEQSVAGYPPVEVIGEEQGHGWCYYFEKADLAKQLHQWDKVIGLYDEVNQKGYGTNMGPELTPFIFGYAMTGDFEKAMELTITAKNFKEKVVVKMNPYLCDQWQEIYSLSQPSTELEEAYQSAMSYLECTIR